MHSSVHCPRGLPTAGMICSGQQHPLPITDQTAMAKLPDNAKKAISDMRDCGFDCAGPVDKQWDPVSCQDNMQEVLLHGAHMIKVDISAIDERRRNLLLDAQRIERASANLLCSTMQPCKRRLFSALPVFVGSMALLHSAKLVQPDPTSDITGFPGRCSDLQAASSSSIRAQRSH